MSIDLVQYRPPRIAMVLLAVATLTNALIWLPIPLVYSPLYVSVLLAASGFTVMMVAWWQFRGSDVAICPTEPTVRLLTNGVYRFTRNPMYLGITMMLAAVALAVGTVPFYVAALLFWLVADRAFCTFEEIKLAASFGASYESYRLRVRRWI